jgi:very-short-patch-repair endonuclease
MKPSIQRKIAELEKKAAAGNAEAANDLRIMLNAVKEFSGQPDPFPPYVSRRDRAREKKDRKKANKKLNKRKIKDSTFVGPDKYPSELTKAQGKIYRAQKNCKMSSGEEMVFKVLVENGLKYERNAYFSDLCFNGRNLMFFYDFYIKELNLIIEYDGEYHYLPIRGKDKLAEQKRKDQIKNGYCKQKKIRLLRIPYTEKDNIRQIINNYLKKNYGIGSESQEQVQGLPVEERKTAA